MRNPALDAWGDYDRDDPYPLFAQVQGDGPVHEVTLADGHAKFSGERILKWASPSVSGRG